MNFQRNLRHCGAILLGSFAFGTATSAIADPISYNFDGRLTYADNFGKPIGNASWQFQAGQKFRGTLVYDVDAIKSSEKDEGDDPAYYAMIYYSPIVSMSFEIDLPNGSYGMDVPIGNSSAYIAADPTDAPDYGVDLYLQSYYPDGSLVAPISESAKIGNWNPNSVFVGLLGTEPVISSTDPNVDLVKIFNGLTGKYGRSFSLSFADSNGELAGYTGGTIENFALQSAVPEPQTWAMLIVGFGAISASLRGRGVTQRKRGQTSHL